MSNFYISAKKLIDKFAVPFQYAIYSEEDDIIGDSTPVIGDKIDVKEVILPYNQGDSPMGSGQTSRNTFTIAGKVVTADMVWYSNTPDVPIMSRVYYHGQTLEVIGVDDWTGYSDMKIYYLKGYTGYGD